MLPEIVFLGGGYKASSQKPEEPFAGGKSQRACIKTLSFKPVPVFHDDDGLLVLTFRFSVLKVHFHRFRFCPFRPFRFVLNEELPLFPKPVLKVSPTGFRLYRFRPLRFMLNAKLLPFLTPIFHPKTQAFKNAVF